MQFSEKPFKAEVGSRILDLRENRLCDDVFDILQEQYYRPSEANRCFLSTSELREVFTENVVCHILYHKRVYPEDQIGDIVPQILSVQQPGTNIQLFTILNLIGEIPYIKNFLDAGICDEDLPLVRGSETYTRLKLSGCRDHSLIFFCAQQWHVLVPLFDFTSGTIIRENFNSEVRMPFLEQSLESWGGQGKIYRVKMHSNHFRATSSIGPEFAIKQFGTEQGQLWKDEVKALTTLSESRFKDKHLIELLCAYEHKDHGLFLIFPLAKGSLSKYWALESRQSHLDEGPRWLLEQCTGLAGGLGKIHSATSETKTDLGRHGDIKPGNILWFQSSEQDRGHLVLADFTSTRFHSSDTVDKSSTGTSGITRAYCPPEVDKKPQIVRTQAFDVWSLGCVYLEFVTWYLFGSNAICKETFVHSCGEKCHSFAWLRLMDDDHHYWEPEDKFFNIIHEEDGFYKPVVKQSVKTWIQMLHRSDQCSPALHAFLVLIEKSMLIVLPSDRMPVHDILVELNKILEAARDPDYCLVGCPWTGATTDACHPPVVANEWKAYNLRPTTRGSVI